MSAAADTTPVTDRLRGVAVDLQTAYTAIQSALDRLVPVHEHTPQQDLMTVQDLRWEIAESRRLLRAYRRRIQDRLAGPTPDHRSQPTSLHDPPNAYPSARSSPP